jgi:phosphatidylserine decarboxylase
MRFSIHREGKKILLSLFALMVTINLLTFQFVESQWVFLLVLSVTSLTYILITQFFRNPRRYTEGVKDTQILSPVDGKVVVIEEVYEGEYLHCNMRQISVFMSPTNVHVTRYPVGGMVEYSKYHPGKYLVAWHPKSSSENERTTVVIDNTTMGKILYRQIAGAMARRIVNYAMVGQTAHRGEDSGFIKFGSRVDVLLPLDFDVMVDLGQKVRGGETVIAEAPKEK